MKMTIGANIKRLRSEKNVTQEQLSAAMNVTCAAVSKWERGETYPDITLLQPLAYYFGVTLDTLMGYDREKIQTEIDEVISLYLNHWKDKKGREIITKAYHDYPDDYRIMHYYMWNIGGDMADNDPEILVSHKDEFLYICGKILEECTDEGIRLNAWNMRAKILHAEGKTKEALEIYKTKFTTWYGTCEQKSEQLFSKDTDEYYFHVQKNMYELFDFAGDKLGRKVFFDPSLSMAEKTDCALKYGDIMINAFEETGEDLFLMIASSFLGRMENDLYYRGGSDDAVTSVMDKNLFVTKKLAERMRENEPLCRAYTEEHSGVKDDIFKRTIDLCLNAKSGRRAELLKNSAYKEVLDKYIK